MAQPARLTTRVLWTLGGTLWLGAVAAGLGVLADYDNRPGTPAGPPARWPADSRLARATDGPTLLMLAHPRCSCTRASLGELAELMARTPHRPRTFVVFLEPGGAADHWEMTDLWRTASAIPGVTAVRDDEGIEARRFGAVTSGQTLLYGADGGLRYSGGTTGSRGHPGDNVGRATLLALLSGERPSRDRTAVFGCELFAPGDADERERHPTADDADHHDAGHDHGAADPAGRTS